MDEQNKAPDMPDTSSEQNGGFLEDSIDLAGMERRTPVFPPEIKLTLETPAPARTDGDDLSAKSLVHAILDNIRIVIVVTLLFLLIGAGLALLYNFNTRTRQGFSAALIVLGFPEAEIGFDPLGNPLNIHAIQSPYVVGNAVREMGLFGRGITAETVRSNLIISEVVPHDFLNRLLVIRDSAIRHPERLIDLENMFYHSTQFVLRLSHSGPLEELTEQELNALLNEIVLQYESYFVNAYFTDFHFMDVIIGHFDYSQYDFFEVVQILQGTVDNMISYVSHMRYFGADYRSPTTQMTFGDIQASLNLISNVDIQRISALVHMNNMSRNRTREAALLEYRITRLEHTLVSTRANAQDALFLAVDIYEPETWVFSAMAEYYGFRRYREIYEFLLDDARHFLYSANALEQEIAFLSNRRESLLLAQHPADPEDVQFVEEAIPILFDSLREWEDVINQTVEDFLMLDLYADAVQLVSPAVFHNSYSVHQQEMILIVVLGGLIGVLIGFMFAIYRSLFSRKAGRART